MSENKILLPHHEQQNLCTTRLPYRQGRKLTAVKVYTIAKESNHLLVFGVPSVNLRQETKSLFLKFGKLLQFTISPDHTVEPFTETFHAQYERIQSARVAKKMLDTKNFYGGSLHVCYAPEFETIIETKQKLVQRQKEVVNRLRNLEMEKNSKAKDQCLTHNTDSEVIKTKTVKSKKLNMGEINTFNINNERIIHKKRKTKPNIVESENKATTKKAKIDNRQMITSAEPHEEIECTEIVEFTSVDKEVVTNINESLNYNKFGNEVIRKIEQRPLNKITINLNKKLV